MSREARLVNSVRVDNARAFGVCWSPDGTRLAVGGRSGARVVTTEGRELWRVAVPPSGVYRIAWSADGRWVAGGPDAAWPVSRIHERDP